MSDADKQVVVTENVATHLPPNERPVIVFGQLSDNQFDKALALFKPPERTMANLWKQKEYTDDLIKVAAFCEAAMFVNPDGGCFTNFIVENNFDNCMIHQYKTDDEDFHFSIREWFNTTRGEVPKELRDWDPKEYEPMPQVKTNVDWFKKLTDIDRQFNGFLALFSNCIDLEEKVNKEVARRKHAASTAFGDHPGTRMPDPIHQEANFDQFTASKLLADGIGSGLQFGGSGLSGRN